MSYDAEGGIVCDECKHAKPLAKINGRYYCYECGRKRVEEHIVLQLRDLERRGLIRLNLVQKNGA